jgi:hypothetical protein
VPDDETIRELAEQLRRCTASIDADGSRGTGFFIDAQHVLTCHHVVGSVTSVHVHAYGREHGQSGDVVDHDEERDLALIRLGFAEFDGGQPAVVLHGSVDDGQFKLAGFPRDDFSAPGLVVHDYEGKRRNAVTGEGINLQLVAPANVTSGQSGGPVMDCRMGAVVAICQYSHDPHAPMGGGCIPVATAAECFAVVRKYLDAPPSAATAWRRLLGPDAWAALGHPWEPRSSLEVHIGGKRSRWRVHLGAANGGLEELEEEDPTRDGTIQDLGEDVAELFFEWAHRPRAYTEDQVSLFGRLLGRALFRPCLQAEFESAVQSEETFLRLVVDGPELVDVPWELAAVPDPPTASPPAFLAADERIRLVRVPGTAAGKPVEGRSAGQSAALLGILVRPEDYDTDELGQDVLKFRDAVDKAGLTADPVGNSEQPLRNPSQDRVERALAAPAGPGRGGFDVVHYQGFGRYRWVPKSGAVAELAFVDEETQEESWMAASEFFAWVGRAGARLLVLELLSPPAGIDLERIPPSALMSALEHVEAVVFTSVPVHHRQARAFNKAFYESLSKPSTVEKAAQEARRTLKRNAPEDDHAVFGWFALAMRDGRGLSVIAARNPIDQAVGGQARGAGTRSVQGGPAADAPPAAGAPTGASDDCTWTPGAPG